MSYDHDRFTDLEMRVEELQAQVDALEEMIVNRFVDTTPKEQKDNGANRLGGMRLG